MYTQLLQFSIIVVHGTYGLCHTYTLYMHSIHTGAMMGMMDAYEFDYDRMDGFIEELRGQVGQPPPVNLTDLAGRGKVSSFSGVNNLVSPSLARIPLYSKLTFTYSIKVTMFSTCTYTCTCTYNMRAGGEIGEKFSSI